ncbi:MAG: hypothetical protein U9R32_05495, partial [Bacteroidota bacterium]|nr:hypothetical protein [Bacteroidota bacterium]
WRTIKIYVAGLQWYYTHILDDEKFAFKIPYTNKNNTCRLFLFQLNFKMTDIIWENTYLL